MGSAIEKDGISIHALREESDLLKYLGHMRDQLFQSTLSVRRATSVAGFHFRSARISIHALREESDLPGKQWSENLRISIHALREESDPCCCMCLWYSLIFQSTLSVRRATDRQLRRHPKQDHFNPRSP